MGVIATATIWMPATVTCTVRSVEFCTVAYGAPICPVLQDQSVLEYEQWSLGQMT